MTSTTQRPSWRRSPEDLALWYSTFEKLAASSTATGAYFDGPHVRSPVSLSLVEQGLAWLEEEHAEELAKHPLPTVKQMLDEMAAPPEATTSTRGRGSPCHNLWHWIHGD